MDGGNWVQSQKLTAFSRSNGDRFGIDVALSEGKVLVGSYGKMYVFHEGQDCKNLPNGEDFYDPCSNCASGTRGVIPAEQNRNCAIISGLHTTENQSSVYPNPTHDKFNLPLQTSWQVFNSYGVQMLKGNSQQVDLSNLENGIYWLKFDNHTQRVVKGSK